MKTTHNGSAMIFATMFVALFTLATGSYLSVVTSGSEGTSRISDSQRAFFAAEAGAHRLLADLNTSGRNTIAGNIATRTYTGNYSATFDNKDTITSTGTVNNIARQVSVKVESLPPGVRAALTLDGPNRWSIPAYGAMTLDGRSYNKDGTVVSPKGVYGLSTRGKLRGNYYGLRIGGKGHVPSPRPHPESYETNRGPMPKKQPWDILGVSEGWFRMNVPLRKGMPPAGFKGIWYTNAQRAYFANLDKVEGVVVVHNKYNTATVNALAGTFKGVLIADNIRYMTRGARILGAAVSTNQRYPLYGWGRWVWTGSRYAYQSSNSLIAYSPEIIKGLSKYVSTSQWTKSAQPGTWTEAAVDTGRNTPTVLKPATKERKPHYKPRKKRRPWYKKLYDKLFKKKPVPRPNPAWASLQRQIDALKTRIASYDQWMRNPNHHPSQKRWVETRVRQPLIRQLNGLLAKQRSMPKYLNVQ